MNRLGRARLQEPALSCRSPERSQGGSRRVSARANKNAGSGNPGEPGGGKTWGQTGRSPVFGDQYGNAPPNANPKPVLSGS